MLIRLILAVTMACLACSSQAKDTITVNLSSEDRGVLSNIKSQDVVYASDSTPVAVFAYIKFSSKKKNIELITYYLEWQKSDEVFFNYSHDDEWMVYDRRINAVDDYYRVRKTITKPDTYRFMVYTREQDGEYRLESTKKIDVRGYD